MSCESSLEVREGLLEFIPLEEAEESSPGHGGFLFHQHEFCC